MYNYSARNKDQKLVSHFSKDEIFYRLLHWCLIEKIWEVWPIEIDFSLKLVRKRPIDDCYFLLIQFFASCKYFSITQYYSICLLNYTKYLQAMLINFV